MRGTEREIRTRLEFVVVVVEFVVVVVVVIHGRSGICLGTVRLLGCVWFVARK